MSHNIQSMYFLGDPLRVGLYALLPCFRHFKMTESGRVRSHPYRMAVCRHKNSGNQNKSS